MTEEKNTGIDIAAMLPRITEEVAASLRERALENLQWTVMEQVRAEVDRYVKESIVPNVHAELQKHDAELRAVFVAAVRQVTTAAADQMVEHAKKKLTGYEGDKFLGDILGKLVRGH